MKLVNLTKHPITLFADDGQTVVAEIPPSGVEARVSTRAEILGWVEVDGFYIPLVRTEFGPVEGLPEPADGVVYIVSTLVARAVAGERDDVVAPDTGPESVIRDADGRIVGIRRFQVF